MREKFIHLSAVAALASVFYLNTFDNFFVWNDWTLIIENFLIKDWRNLPEVFTSAFWKPLIGEPPQIYRPLVSLSFMADFSLWRLNPWGYHLTNTVLHGVNSILSYFLARIYVTPVTALMAALLFAVHPIHTEAVTYISGRGELIVTFFLLSGVLVFLKSEKYTSWLLYLVSLPFFFLALLTKETAVIFPLLLLAADVTAIPSSWQSDPSRRLARHIGPLLVLGAFYFLRNIFVGITSVYPLAVTDFVHHLLLFLKAIPLYLGLLLFPWNLHFLHPLRVSYPMDLQIFLAVLLLFGAGWWLRYAARSGNQAVRFALLWFLIGLAPVVYFIGLDLPLLEGWSYLPSIGFVLLAALGLEALKRWTPSATPLLLALWIGVVLGGITFYRNRDWKNDMQISLDTIAASPDDPIALRLIGNAYFRRWNTPEAEKMFQKGLRLAPFNPGLHRSLGALYRFVGKESDALHHYGEAIKFASTEPYAYWILGHYSRRLGKLTQAEKYFSAATNLFPYSSELHQDLALTYYLQGKLDAAERELKAALKISPYSPELKANLDVILKSKRP